MHIEHIAIWTHDLERLKSFYQEYFDGLPGEKYTNPAHQYEAYFLSFASGARLELMQMPTIPASQDDPAQQFTGLIHIAFSIGTELGVDALMERLRLDGHQIIDRPRHTGDGYYESVVLDPDGNRIEITV